MTDSSKGSNQFETMFIFLGLVIYLNQHQFLRFMAPFKYFPMKKNYLYHQLSSKLVTQFNFRLCILLQIRIFVHSHSLE